MHPVLFEIPFPTLSIPLGATLFVMAALGVLIALLGFRKKAIDLEVIGIGAALLGLILGFMLRGRVYVLTGLPVYGYGTMLCLSLVSGWFLSLKLGERDGLSRDVMAACYFVTALAALAGARLLYILTNLAEFDSLFSVFALRRGGLVAYGGFLGGLLGSWLYLRRQQQALLPWADVAVPSLGLGLLLTRIGCYLFGCDFGRPLAGSAPAWLERLGTFPRWSGGALDGSGSPAWIQHVRERGLSVLSEASLPVHPTQLYEALVGAGLLALTLYLRRVRRFPGEVFLIFAFVYAVCRFVLEIVRDDSERGVFGPVLREPVIVSVGLLMLGVACALGPLQSIARRKLRYVGFALAFAPAVLGYVILRPAEFARANYTQLSTSQWIAILSAFAVAFGYRKLTRAAIPADSEPVPHPARG